MNKNLQTALIQSGYRCGRGVWTKPIAGVTFSCNSALGLSVHCPHKRVATFDEGLDPTSNEWQDEIAGAEHRLICQMDWHK